MKPRPYGSFARALSRIRDTLGEAACAQALGRSGALVSKWCDPDHDALPTLRQAVQLDVAYVLAEGGEPPILITYADQIKRIIDQQPAETLDLLRFVVGMQATLSDLGRSFISAIDADGAAVPGSANGSAPSITLGMPSSCKREILEIIEHLQIQTLRLQRAIESVTERP